MAKSVILVLTLTLTAPSLSHAGSAIILRCNINQGTKEAGGAIGCQASGSNSKNLGEATSCCNLTTCADIIRCAADLKLRVSSGSCSGSDGGGENRCVYTLTKK